MRGTFPNEVALEHENLFVKLYAYVPAYVPVCAGTMKYPWNGQPAPERSHVRVFNTMLRAGQFKDGIDGIKGSSVLMEL